MSGDVEGRECETDIECLLPGSCVSGECVGFAPVDCDDGNTCTVDTCRNETGCANTAVTDESECAPKNLCHEYVCGQGECQSGRISLTTPGCSCTGPALITLPFAETYHPASMRFRPTEVPNCNVPSWFVNSTTDFISRPGVWLKVPPSGTRVVVHAQFSATEIGESPYIIAFPSEPACSGRDGRGCSAIGNATSDRDTDTPWEMRLVLCAREPATVFVSGSHVVELSVNIYEEPCALQWPPCAASEPCVPMGGSIDDSRKGDYAICPPVNIAGDGCPACQSCYFRPTTNTSQCDAAAGVGCVQDADCNSIHMECGVSVCVDCQCAVLPVHGEECWDGNSCTFNDTCVNGMCLGMFSSNP
jgi:hypothetical protein